MDHGCAGGGLRVSGARGALGVMLKAGGTWGLRLDSSPGAALHVVSRGTMWLHVQARNLFRCRPETPSWCRRAPHTG